MSETTKTVGTNVISTMSVALRVPVDRFQIILALAKGAVNFQPTELEDQEKMAQEWNTHMITVCSGLIASEAAVFGAIVGLYLHEGILEQMGVEDGEEEDAKPQLTEEGEMPWSTVDEDGKEYGWVHDSRIDVA